MITAVTGCILSSLEPCQLSTAKRAGSGEANNCQGFLLASLIIDLLFFKALVEERTFQLSLLGAKLRSKTW